MKPGRGVISVYHDNLYYTLTVSSQGWLVGELVQYLDRVLLARDRTSALLKLLGLMLEMSPERPLRSAHGVWVEVDLEGRVLETNSELIRKAVNQQPPDDSEPYLPFSLSRIFEVLDRFNFTVKLH